MDARRRLLDSERRSPENAHTGLLDALVVGGDLSPEEAASAVAKAERTEQPTREVYRWLQTLIAPQRLVNKSPENARLLQILARGERWFHDALYIHLVRSPAAMIQSCKEIGIVLGYTKSGAPSWFGAELLWVQEQRIIESFLVSVPEERQTLIRFEDLYGIRIGPCIDFVTS